jgi:hypothetical protein
MIYEREANSMTKKREIAFPLGKSDTMSGWCNMSLKLTS